MKESVMSPCESSLHKLIHAPYGTSAPYPNPSPYGKDVDGEGTPLTIPHSNIGPTLSASILALSALDLAPKPKSWIRPYFSEESALARVET